MTAPHKSALITGATSGIGVAFAEALAARGYDLLVTGRRREKIKAAMEELEGTYGIATEIVIADFTVPSDMARLMRTIKRRARLAALVNNAGFGLTKSFLEDQYDAQKPMLTVLVDAVTRITHAAVPKLRANGGGFIINVSSLAAFLPNPQSELYCATKAYINAFSEAVYTAVRPDNIDVQALCPGFTRTDFHKKLGKRRAELKDRGVVRWMSAESVVQHALEHVGSKRVIYIPGFTNKLVYALTKLAPRSVYLKAASKRRRE